MDGNTPYWYYTIYHGGSSAAGWTTQGPPTGTAQVWSVVANGVNPFTGVVENGSTFVPCNFQTGMTFTDLAGVKHNLNLAAFASAFTQSGATYTCSSGSNPEVEAPGGDGQVAGTIDPTVGSSTFLAQSSNNATTSDFVVTDKDGTAYFFPYGFQQSFPGGDITPWLIEDRNGNRMSAFGDSAGRATVTPTGNSVTFDSPTGAQNSPGAQTFTESWGTVSPNYQVTVNGGSGSSSVGCMPFPTTVAGAPRQVFNSIAMPNRQQYIFYYGTNNPTDSTILNNYGLINEIIYPDGGWVKYKWQLPSAYNEYSTMSGDQSHYELGRSASTFCLAAPTLFLAISGHPFYRSVKSASTDLRSLKFKHFHCRLLGHIRVGSPMAGHRRPLTVQTTDNSVGLTSQTVYTIFAIYGSAPAGFVGGNRHDDSIREHDSIL